MKLRTLTLRSIPDALLESLRAAARANRRSLNAEVLWRLESGVDSVGSADRGPAGGGAAAVRESGAPPYEVRRAFEEADLARLRSDLALTPEQRVHLGEELARAGVKGRARPGMRRVLQFETYDDYLDWKRLGDRNP